MPSPGGALRLPHASMFGVRQSGPVDGLYVVRQVRLTAGSGTLTMPSDALGPAVVAQWGVVRMMVDVNRITQS